MAISEKKLFTVKPRVFISYSRKDGEKLAKNLRTKLEKNNIPLWQDRVGMEGGKDWWLQIVEALDKVEFMVLVMTPKAIESDIIRKEWRYARQKGVCVYPIKGVPDEQLDYEALPRWMRSAQFYDLDYEWDKFINDLNTRCEVPRVPFMVDDLPDYFIERPEEFNMLINQLLNTEREEPLAITTALRGAAGFGKTTLATALCHDDRVQDAYDDGILWVTLGEAPGDISEKLKDLIEIMSGERPGFTDIKASTARFVELLADRDVLIVIDDVWDIAHSQPFLQGGSRCSRLITTRNSDNLPHRSRHNIIDAMQPEEALALLGLGLPKFQTEELMNFARRLGRWPLILKMVNAFLYDRVVNGGQSMSSAFAYVKKRLDKKGISAFDIRDTKERNQAVERTLSVSLELLDQEEIQRFSELCIFPEDIDIPLETVEKLWSNGAFDDLETEDLCQRLYRLSLLRNFNLNERSIRLHDVIRSYLRKRNECHLPLMHQRFLDRYGVDQWVNLPASEPYLWKYLTLHLADSNHDKELHELLCDYQWIRRKMTVCDLNTLLGDYDYIAGDHEAFLIQSALRLSANIINHDPSQLTPHLLGRLMDRSLPGVKKLLDQSVASQKGRWLRPYVSSSLAPAGGHLLRTLEGHNSTVNAVAISPDGKTAVSGSGGSTVKLWDLVTGQVIHTLKGHSGSVYAVAFSPDGKTAVSGSGDRTVKLWDLDTGQAMHTFEGHNYPVNAVAFSLDSKIIISASVDRTLKLWDLDTGQTIHTLKGHCGSVYAVAISPSSKISLSGSADETLKLWDLDTGQAIHTLKGHSGWVKAVAISPDGKTAVSGSGDRTIKLWALGTGQAMHTFEGHSGPVNAVAISPNSKTAVSGSADHTLKLWDLGTGHVVHTFEGHSSWVKAVAISPDGKMVVSGSHDRTIKLWDLNTGQIIQTFKGHRGTINAVAISADGKTLLSASIDRKLKLWDLSTAQAIYTFKGHSDWVNAVAISPDSKTALSGAVDHSLKLWDLGTAKAIHILKAHSGSVTAVAFSPDGKTAVSGSHDRTVKLWDLNTGQVIHTLKGHSDWVNAVAINPEGKTAVSGSHDCSLKLWDLNEGKVISSFTGESAIESVAVSPFGGIVIAGQANGCLHFFRIEGSTRDE